MKIYLLGVILTYILFKVIRVLDKDYTWKGFIISVAISLFSWFALALGVVFMIQDYYTKNPGKAIVKYFSRIWTKLGGDAPKWL